MTPAVFAIVAASSACRAVLGSPPNMRFYPFGEAPQDKPPVYAVWQMPFSTPENYLGQVPDVDDSRVQIDVYGATQASTDAAALAIRDAVQEHANMVNSVQRPRDPLTRNYGYMLDFEFIHYR
jgi:hypothetical protein